MSKNEDNPHIINFSGDLKSDLNWNQAKSEAHFHIAQGKKILWSIDLGLFSPDTLPITNQTQYLSLMLSLEHFRDTIWKEFHSNSLGLCIYKGDADFSTGFHWCDEMTDKYQSWLKLQGLDDGQNPLLKSLFCRDFVVDYLSLLADRIPDEIPCYLSLHVFGHITPLFELQLLHPERFSRFNMVISGGNIPLECLQKENFSIQIGMCLPKLELRHPSNYYLLNAALDYFLEKKIKFRIISETHLTTLWDGLDYLIYMPESLSQEGKRKLQGFSAAGGTTVTLGNKLGFSQEMTWHEWINNYK